jgi:hypothetical protein
MIPRVPLREALSDPNLLGTAIAGESWGSWRTLLIAAMGEALCEDERATFRALTGRDREPPQRVDQFAAVIGRRGGKSRAMATLATYIAGLCDHSDALVPGERGVLLCVALDQRVAKIILDYAEASFERSPILKQLIASRTADALELTNGITLEVRPASFRKLNILYARTARKKISPVNRSPPLLLSPLIGTSKISPVNRSPPIVLCGPFCWSSLRWHRLSTCENARQFSVS